MNSRALSPVLGFVLIFATIVASLGIVQTFFVPAWIKNDEWEHYLTIEKDVISIPKLVALSASSKNPNMITLTLGVKRSDYPFLITPPDTGSVLLVKKEKVWIRYNVTLPNGTTVEKVIPPIDSVALIVKPKYYYLPKTEFIYEHSAVFVKANGISTLVEQNIFSNNSITFYIFNTNFDSIASESVVSIPLRPISVGGKIAITNATIKFETLNPEYWNRTLRNLGLTPTIEGNNITVRCYNTILSIAIVGSENVDLKLWYKPYVPITSLYVFSGEEVYIDVYVLDQFGNPAPNVRVNGSLVPSTIGELDPIFAITNPEGVAKFKFKASNPGRGVITFESGGNSTILKVTVVNRGNDSEDLWDRYRNNQSLIVSPDFIWTGIHDASSIILRNATRIDTRGHHEHGDFEIKFVLYNNTKFYYFEIWDYGRVRIYSNGDLIFDGKLNNTAWSNVFNENGTDILNGDNYVWDNTAKLGEIKSFLENSTPSNPANLAVQEIEEGWVIEVQII